MKKLTSIEEAVDSRENLREYLKTLQLDEFERKKILRLALKMSRKYQIAMMEATA